MRIPCLLTFIYSVVHVDCNSMHTSDLASDSSTSFCHASPGPHFKSHKFRDTKMTCRSTFQVLRNELINCPLTKIVLERVGIEQYLFLKSHGAYAPFPRLEVLSPKSKIAKRNYRLS